MNRSIREHQRTIWPIMFLWEVIAKFNVNIDAISDEELDAITYLSKLYRVINRFATNIPNVERQGILELRELYTPGKMVGIENLEQYSFEEMALLIYPKEFEG